MDVYFKTFVRIFRKIYRPHLFHQSSVSACKYEKSSNIKSSFGELKYYTIVWQSVKILYAEVIFNLNYIVLLFELK